MITLSVTNDLTVSQIWWDYHSLLIRLLLKVNHIIISQAWSDYQSFWKFSTSMIILIINIVVFAIYLEAILIIMEIQTWNLLNLKMLYCYCILFPLDWELHFCQSCVIDELQQPSHQCWVDERELQVALPRLYHEISWGELPSYLIFSHHDHYVLLLSF